MKRFLGLIAIVGMTGCYIGDTDDAIRISSIRALQVNPTKEVCDDALGSFAGVYRTVPALKAAATARAPDLLTYFFVSNVTNIPYGFNNDDLNGTGHNTFLADSIVLEYESDAVSLPTEKLATAAAIPELTDGTSSCAQAEILGPQAQKTLGNLVLVDPIVVKVHVHFEGKYVNGKVNKTANSVMPITVFPN